MLAEVGERDIKVFGIELDAHEEESGFLICVFVRMQNVSAMAIDEVGDGRDFSLCIRATDEQNGGGFHLSG